MDNAFRQILREIEQDLSILQAATLSDVPRPIAASGLKEAIKAPIIPGNTRFSAVKRLCVRLLRPVTRRQDHINAALLNAIEILEQRVESLERALL